MTRYPGAVWKPLGADQAHQPLITRHDIVCLHTMVGSLEGTYNYFKGQGYTGTESHFGTGPNGEVWEFTDLDRTADANLDGNWHVVSIENADSGTGYPAWSGSNVPAFTDKQIDALVDLVAWLCDKYDIPAVLIENTLPGHRGVAYHRQGIDPWRVSGGEKWSSSTGKVCPGDRRIEQLKDVILPRVRAKLNQKQQVPWPVRGDHSPAVLDVKKRLDFAGYEGLAMNDFFGVGLTEAIKQFQLDHDALKNDADGKFGPLTWQMVKALPLPGGTFKDSPAVIQLKKDMQTAIDTLKKNNHPTWASWVQNSLNQLNNR